MDSDTKHHSKKDGLDSPSQSSMMMSGDPVADELAFIWKLAEDCSDNPTKTDSKDAEKKEAKKYRRRSGSESESSSDVDDHGRRRRDSRSPNESSNVRKSSQEGRRGSSRKEDSKGKKTHKHESHSYKEKDRRKGLNMSRSPRRTKSPERRRSRERKYSPDRRSQDRRSPNRRRSPGRRRSPDGYRHTERRRRTPDRKSPIRSHRRSRSKSRDRDRRPRHSPKRRRRESSGSKSPPPRGRYESGKGICRAVLPPPGKGKDSKEPLSTEQVEAKLNAHMQRVKTKAAEDAKNINLPSYLNPAMVNVQQFKVQQEKRKLLWSAKKIEEKCTGTSSAVWGQKTFTDVATDAKFKQLMGIKNAASGESSEKIERSRKAMEELEKEYEKSRVFQLSRGAGGVTGIGLGFGHSDHA